MGMYWTGCKVPEDCTGMKGNMGVGAKCQGNAGEYMGVWGMCPENAGKCSGMPRERTGVGAKHKGNAGECRGMLVEHMGMCAMCQGHHGNAGECHGNVQEWVQTSR